MTQTIETIAPGFSGFYASMWEFDYDYVITDINEIREEKELDPIDSNSIDVDNTSYKNYIGKEYCKALVSNVLHNSILMVEFKEIDSPREYNFTTDKIVCDVIIDTDKVSEWVKDNRETLAEYVQERFKSRDGFTPFYSNDIEVWDEATNGFTNFDFEDGWVYINGIMEVMFDENTDQEMDLYSNMERYYSEYVTNFDELINE